MDIAVLDACPGFKEDVLHATQDRNESVEVQGLRTTFPWVFWGFHGKCKIFI